MAAAVGNSGGSYPRKPWISHGQRSGGMWRRRRAPEGRLPAPRGEDGTEQSGTAAAARAEREDGTQRDAAHHRPSGSARADTGRHPGARHRPRAGRSAGGREPQIEIYTTRSVRGAARRGTAAHRHEKKDRGEDAEPRKAWPERGPPLTHARSRGIAAAERRSMKHEKSCFAKNRA